MAVTIRATKPAGNTITFGLDGFPAISGGIGGWETIDRPRRPAAAGWVSTPAMTVELPLVLNGMEARGIGRDRVIDADLATLTRWGKKKAATGQPPILRVTGVKGVPASTDWVLTDIKISDVIVNRAGKRVQASLTVTLLAYRHAALVKSPAKKAREKKPKKPTKPKKGKKK